MHCLIRLTKTNPKARPIHVPPSKMPLLQIDSVRFWRICDSKDTIWELGGVLPPRMTCKIEEASGIKGKGEGQGLRGEEWTEWMNNLDLKAYRLLRYDIRRYLKNRDKIHNKYVYISLWVSLSWNWQIICSNTANKRGPAGGKFQSLLRWGFRKDPAVSWQGIYVW